MSIYVQCKCGSGVSEVALQRFDIVAGAKGCYGIAVAQIVKSCVRPSDRCGGTLKVAVDDVLVIRSAKIVGKYETEIVPSAARIRLFRFLRKLVLP